MEKSRPRSIDLTWLCRELERRNKERVFEANAWALTLDLVDAEYQKTLESRAQAGAACELKKVRGV